MTDDEKKITVVVPDRIEAIRLDKYLAEQEELDFSRSFIQQIIADGLLFVDGRAVSKKYKLRGGENIELTIPPPPEPDLTPEDIPLDIVYEDQYLAIVNKPPGLVVHPAPGNPNHTLVNALLYRFGRISDDETDIRPGIVHRLDKNTSGLLIVALDDSTARKLREQLAERKITKIYKAVICGHLPETEATINLPIGRSLKDRKKMSVTNVSSREAITKYKVTERFRFLDLVDAELVTGRTHQLRVHFAHLNRPVLGDPDYGGRTKWIKGIDPSLRISGRELLEIIDRQALHAQSLRFDHPVTGKEMEISSELPEDMQKLIDTLQANYR
ncbi:MAG: RluA family pseudouridine synthase [FCB group bacterium]|nr:RluA family pseudouridine synthase [FCB group bacterium]